MRLSFTQKYQPVTLDDVVGQPAIIRQLKTFALEPYPRCILLEGRGGVGKSATAQALIHDLGVDPIMAVYSYAASRLTVSEVRRLFDGPFRTRPLLGEPWNVLLVEELEREVSPEVRIELKTALSEQYIPERLIVVATSNNSAGLDRALIQRFGHPFSYESGPYFAEACRERLQAIWAVEVSNEPFPLGIWEQGWDGDGYSMRLALKALGAAVDQHRERMVAA